MTVLVLLLVCKQMTGDFIHLYQTLILEQGLLKMVMGDPCKKQNGVGFP